MKKLKGIKSIHIGKKGRIAGAVVLTLVVCAAAVMQVKPDLVATLTGNEIPPHDGDVLVDSLNVSKDEVKAEKNETESVASDDGVEKNTDKTFAEERANINLDRNEVIAMLTDTIAQADNEAEKKNATEQKLKIIKYMDQEQIIEKLIKTKDLPEALVIITDNSVNVTVNTQELLRSDVTKIYDIVMRETGRDAGEIVVQNKTK